MKDYVIANLLKDTVEIFTTAHGNQGVCVGEVGYHSYLITVLKSTTDGHDCMILGRKEESAGRELLGCGKLLFIRCTNIVSE